MDAFAAMADPARRRIIDILASGEHTSGEIAEVIGVERRISRTAVSKHLRLLRDARLVDVRADVRWRWYFLDPTGFESLEAVVHDLRLKVDSAIGWDSINNRKYDPLAAALPVRRKGPGRPERSGTRGRQSVIPQAADPWDGLFPVWPVVDAFTLEE